MKLLDEGYPMRRLSKESGIRRNQLYDLRKRYQAYGEDGLRRKERYFASDAEKASVRAEIMGKSLPLSEICLKYGISEGAIYSWRKTEGKQLQSPMARRKKDAPLSELEELKIRNEYLEAENALLKKVKALVEARDARLKGTGRKPSSN